MARSTLKAKPLQRTLWELEQRWGKPAATLGMPNTEVESAHTLSTGFHNLDVGLCAGGICTGQITLIVGAPTSGVTTLAYRLLASGQGRSPHQAEYKEAEHGVVYADLACTFDPFAASACGVHLDSLLVLRLSVREESAMAAAEACRDVVRTAAVRAIVLDLTESALVPTPTVRRLHEAVTRSACAVICLAHPRNRHVEAEIGQVAHTILRLENLGWLKHDENLIGYRAGVQVLKDKPRVLVPQVEVDVPISMQEFAG